jgi:hypothetical protein
MEQLVNSLSRVWGRREAREVVNATLRTNTKEIA